MATDRDSGADVTSSSTQDHRRRAEQLPPVVAAVLTISDSRTPDTDGSGALMKALLTGDGHSIAHYAILKDEPEQIRREILQLCQQRRVDIILTNGGTGIAPRDGTFEAISSLIERPLPGFGEIFRMLSWNEVGPAAMLSRATAGVRGETLIFSTPGSSNAVEVAMRKLILPELKHLVAEMKGKRR